MDELMKSLEELKSLACCEARPSLEQTAEEFQTDLFWTDIVGVTTRLPHEVMKANVLYQKPPYPGWTETASLWRAIARELWYLATLCKSFPVSQGLTLRSQMTSHFRKITHDVDKFIINLKESVTEKKAVSPEPAAIVLESCEELKNQCRDNRTAVLNVINEQLELAKDCSREFAETIAEMEEKKDQPPDSDDDEPEDELAPNWCSRDFDLAKATLGFVRTVCNCVKKTAEFISSHEQSELASELEVIAECGAVVSRDLDELVTELYPTVHVTNVVDFVAETSRNMRRLLSSVRNCERFTDADVTWNDFLVKALDHNLTNVENLSMQSRLG